MEKKLKDIYKYTHIKLNTQKNCTKKVLMMQITTMVWSLT